jgi:hypothetical protein
MELIDLQTLVPEIPTTLLVTFLLYAIGLAQTAREIIKAKRKGDWTVPFVIAVCVVGMVSVAAITPGFSILFSIVVGFAAAGVVKLTNFKSGSDQSDTSVPVLTDAPVIEG